MATQTPTQRKAAARKAAATRKRNESTASRQRAAAGKKAAATRRRNAAGRSAKTAQASAKRTATAAAQTAEAGAEAGAFTVERAAQQAQRAVLIPVGAALVARDNVVEAVQPYTKRDTAERELNKLQRQPAPVPDPNPQRARDRRRDTRGIPVSDDAPSEKTPGCPPATPCDQRIRAR